MAGSAAAGGGGGGSRSDLLPWCGSCACHAYAWLLVSYVCSYPLQLRSWFSRGVSISSGNAKMMGFLTTCEPGLQVPAGWAMGLRLLGNGCHPLDSTLAKEGRSNSENYAWFESSGSNSGVSKTGVDFVPSALLESADSPKEVLKQAMLHHEDMFRNQVLELHRLYWTQKNLMNDLCWRDFDKIVVSTDNQTPNRGTEMDSMVDSLVMNSTLAQSGSIFQECIVHHTRRGILNLQLPVEEHIKNADTEHLEMQSSLHHKRYSDSDSDELELTLGNKKQGNNERKGVAKTLCGKDDHLSTKDVFDLEKSTAFMSSDDVSVISSFDCQSRITDSACMPSAHLAAGPYVTFTGRTRKEAIHRPFIYNPNADHGERLSENSSLHLDFGWLEFGRCFSTYIVSQEPQPTFNNPRSFDLNITKFESFPEISQNEVNLPSSLSSSTVPSGILSGPHANTVATPPSWRELSDKSSEETSDVLQTSDRNSASMHSQAKEADFLTHGYGLHLYRGQASTEKTELAGCAGNSNQEEDNLLTLISDSEYMAEPPRNSKDGIFGSFDGNGLACTDESPSLSPSGLYRLSNEDAEKSIGFPGCYIQSERKNVKTMSIVDEKGHKNHPSIQSSNRPQKASAYSELKQSNCDKQLNCEKCEEDTVSSSQCRNLISVEGAISVPLEETQDEHNGADPIGEKLGHTERNKAGSRNNAEVEGHSVPSMNDNIQANEISLVVAEKCTGKLEAITEAEDHAALLEKSCSSSESTDKCLEKKEKHEAEMDGPIWRAAESLIHISLRNTTSTSDKVANVGQMEMENEETNDQPQNSFDSFESMVLMLTETINDEYYTPARLTEVETGKGKRRFKLRKGRGLRDFQRDVLPGLVSLSRHEICEDLHTIAEAVRLHELRYGSKKLSRGNWFTPVRSRRSRLSYAGKRQ